MVGGEEGLWRRPLPLCRAHQASRRHRARLHVRTMSGSQRGWVGQVAGRRLPGPCPRGATWPGPRPSGQRLRLPAPWALSSSLQHGSPVAVRLSEVVQATNIAGNGRCPSWSLSHSVCHHCSTKPDRQGHSVFWEVWFPSQGGCDIPSVRSLLTPLQPGHTGGHLSNRLLPLLPRNHELDLAAGR